MYTEFQKEEYKKKPTGKLNMGDHNRNGIAKNFEERTGKNA